MNTMCALCFRFVKQGTGWKHHRDGCDRILNGTCSCTRRVCPECSPNTTIVTPLAALMRLAHAQHLQMVEEAA